MGQGHSKMREVVLVVEDDPILRLNAVDIVEEAGFIALEATNADDAISLLEARDDIRIVFTDIEMPGSMDGLKLALAVRDRWPPVKLIVTSGKFAIKDGDLPEGGLYFPKPYLPAAIAQALHSLAGH